jgi:hypothetical protein
MLPLQETWAPRMRDCFYSCQQQGGNTRKASSRTEPIACGQSYQNNPQKGKAPTPRPQPQVQPAKIKDVVDNRDPPEETEAQTEEPPPYDLKHAETMICTMKAEDHVKLLENISFLEGF